MSDAFDPSLYPVPGLHVDAGDGDRRTLLDHHTDAIEAISKLFETSLMVRDQHRTQIDALRESVRSLERSLRLRDKEIERLTARVHELEANEPPAPWASTPKHNDQEAP